MNKVLKYTLITLPVFVGAYIVYRQVKMYKVPSPRPQPAKPAGYSDSNNGSATTATPASVNIVEGACVFPLKKGTYNNACVGALQEALGITMDNDFGKNTESVLLAKTGKTQIANVSELVQVINQLNTSTISNRQTLLAKSEQLIGILTNNMGKFKYIQLLKNTSLKKVEQDLDNENEWQRVPLMINLAKGQRLNLVDYMLVSQPDYKTGNVIITCYKGSNIGYWMVSPDDIIFV